jgi:GNAT superfamily N-acetyltransferase
MASWIEGALSPDWRFDDVVPWVEAGQAALISDAASAPIGLAVVVSGAPEADAASVPLIAVEPARRFRGLGGEAALALERHLRARHGMERVFAPVPDGRGLAVYFWLRAGYRPLTVSDAPWPLVGLTGESRPGIWMLRDEA